MSTPKITHSTRQLWRDGPITCFAWPTFEVLQVDRDVGNVGGDILIESDLPDWRNRVAEGRNATTNRIATESSLDYIEGHVLIGRWCNPSLRYGMYQYDGDLFIGHTNVWNKPGAPPTLVHAQTQDEALQRAISDARSKQSHFRGGNFLAELGDTIRGLRNPAKGFRGLLDTYRGNARKRVQRAVGRRSLPRTQQDMRRLERDAPDVGRAAQRALSDSWLEANFGWAPLLSDAVDAYKAIRALAARVPLVRFFGQAENSDAPTFTHSTRNMEVTPMHFTVRTQFVYDCAFYGAVKVEVDSPPSGQAVEEMGVRARDFIPAVWEAIPYSFLIDYFTNVGNIIEAVSFPRSDLAWISRTFRNHSIRSTDRVAIGESSLTYPVSNSNVTFAFKPPYVKWDRKYYNRSIYTGSIVPSLRFEIPGSRNWKKWLNVAALARMRTL